MSELDQLLEKTSRTFALCIPLLPEPTQREVGIAYLLFRIADTFEDAVLWSQERRVAALEAFTRLMETPSVAEAQRMAHRWGEGPPIEHDGYLELLSQTSLVVSGFLRLDARAQQIIKRHVQRTARRMAGFVGRTDEQGHLHLDNLADLRAYCYAVAGIVGEMLTELFVLGQEALASIQTYLTPRAPLFGEGLQLTNILKDAAVDAAEGRRFLPPGVKRQEVFALARQDLDAAAEYTLALQVAGAPRGLVVANALPLRLAWATLDRVEDAGAGAKLTRPEVFAIVQQLHEALDEHQPVLDYAVPSLATLRGTDGQEQLSATTSRDS